MRPLGLGKIKQNSLPLRLVLAELAGGEWGRLAPVPKHLRNFSV